MTATTERTEEESNDADVISLTVPAAPQFARLVRIAAASIARRRGLSIRAIDDLRLAVDETFSLLLGDNAHTGSVSTNFEVDAHELVVVITQQIPGGVVPSTEEAQLAFKTVINDLVDRCEINPEVGVVQFSKLLS